MFCPLQLDGDEAQWIAGPYDDDVDHDEEGAYGVEAMCRLVSALHAKSTMPTALQLVPAVSPQAHCIAYKLEVYPWENACYFAQNRANCRRSRAWKRALGAVTQW